MPHSDDISKLVSKENLISEHQKLHELHKGHESMHLEMLLVLLFTLFIVQIILVHWKQRHYKSFMQFTLFGLYFEPLYFSITLGWKMFVLIWLIFTVVICSVLWKLRTNPLDPSTPRFVYSCFLLIHKVSYVVGVLGYIMLMMTLFGVHLMFKIHPQQSMDVSLSFMFLGIYFGVLGRDFAEIFTDGVAARLGYTSSSGLPSRKLELNVCACCGQEIISSLDTGDVVEAYSKLGCGHVFHEYCIRGWIIVGKKQTCPYCKEKVDLKRMFSNPWEKPHLLFGHLCDWVRYLVAWQPIIIAIVQGITYVLGLE